MSFKEVKMFGELLPNLHYSFPEINVRETGQIRNLIQTERNPLQ